MDHHRSAHDPATAVTGLPVWWRSVGAGVALAILLLAPGGTAQAVVGTPVELSTANPRVRIVGSGWGHGVGMSQYGAQAQALQGWSAKRILRHWYSGIDVGHSARSARSITVNLSTVARSPGVVVEAGSARWQACAPRCTWLKGGDGARLVQRADSGTWTVVATGGGDLSVRRDGVVLWRGSTGTTLRVQLSGDRTERTIARVLGRRYRWGALEIGAYGNAACRAAALCVNVRVPSVERYLYGLAEMPSSWANAALRAQAIVGRTYALRMVERGTRGSCRCHLLATPADQVYAGLGKEEGPAGERWVAQVDASEGRVVRYRGALAATFYSSSHGRRSERIGDSWAFSAPTSDYPYLDSMADPYSADPAARNPYARWTVTLSNGDFARYVDRRLRRVTGISIRSRTVGGTPRELVVTGVDGHGRTLTVAFAGVEGKQVGDRRVWIVGAELKRRFDLRSQQIRRIGLTPFTDDDGNVHEQAIATLAAADVTAGCDGDRFCPSDQVTRAQTAALLARALQLPATSVDAFTDDGGSIHEPAIDAVAYAGLASGCTTTGFASGGAGPPRVSRNQDPRSLLAVGPPGVSRNQDPRSLLAVGPPRVSRNQDPRSFCPGRALTRGQMASLLVRAFELRPTATDAFGDDNGSVHEDSINRLAAAGITDGTVTGGFGPGGVVTRAQLASFLVRALDSV